MSKLDDYLWFEINMYEIQKLNIHNYDYVVIEDHKVLDFINSYVDALELYGDNVSIFFIRKL